MKVIILAGGFGTRLAEYTDTIPKPMVPIGGLPIIWHIMQLFSSYGHKDFYVALGYKADIIKEYFLNYRTLNADFTVDMGTGEINIHQMKNVDWKVTLIDTGINSLTGGRVKRMQPFVGSDTIMLTYGDGLSNVNINELIKFHKSHGKLVTVTAVHPGARFGELVMENNKVTAFEEKPQTGQGWINGGFFVIEPGFFDLIEDDYSILEQKPLETAARIGELMAYRHEGFWQCMDTKRDRDNLEEQWNSGNIAWKK